MPNDVEFQKFKAELDYEAAGGERQKRNTKQYRDNYNQIDWSKPLATTTQEEGKDNA